MKKIVLLMVAAGAGFSALAQIRGGDNYYAQKLTLDVNCPVGLLMQSPTYKLDANYTNVAKSDIGKLKMGAGLSYGADVQLGFFVGKRRRFGIGTGITYLMQKSDATIDNFHVEYQETDKLDNTFRQVVYATGAVKEKLSITNISIPVVLKFKQRFTTRLGFTVDAGILYNITMKNDWSSDAKFNYEAIYQYGKGSNGALVTVYDKNETPDKKDWLITFDQYTRHNSIGTVPGIFDSLRSRGYIVALGVAPSAKSGSISYTTGSIGIVLRPAINMRVTNRVHLNLGAYFAYQTFNNKTVDGYKLIDNVGAKYSSLLNTVSSTTNTTLGLNIGVRYFIGEPKDSDFDGKFDE